MSGLEEYFLRIIDQTTPMPNDNISSLEAGAAEALDRQFRFVEELPLSGGDPVVVPDTNAVIFNPALEHWVFEEFSSFRLVVTPTLLSELDQLKMRTSDVREKAERVIRQIREYRRRGDLFDGVPLRKGVSTILAVATEPHVENAATWLHPDNQDDRLIASAIDIARRDVRVPLVIVTRDANLENKADFAGIPCLHPPTPSGAPDVV